MIPFPAGAYDDAIDALESAVYMAGAGLKKLPKPCQKTPQNYVETTSKLHRNYIEKSTIFLLNREQARENQKLL